MIGNPVACVAGLAVLDVIDEEGLLERAVEIGNVLRHRLEQVAAQSTIIGDVRGLGAMIGMEMVSGSGGYEPAKGAAQRCLDEMVARGVIAATAGVYNQVVRFLPPLVTGNAELHEATDVIEQALVAAAQAN